VDTTGAARHAMSALRAQTLQVSAARKDKVVAALRSNPNVAYVEVDRVRKAYDVQPDDPMYTDGKQPEVDQVKLPAAWETTKGDGVKIAVLDTGVNAVGDLTGAVLPGYNYVSNNTNAADDYGHGTMAASLIAARGDNGRGMAGACWTCAILPVKVLDRYGSGYDSDIAKGIVWATDHGAKIINMSLGGPGNSKVLADAVAYANLKNVLVVASAGNEGLDDDLKNAKQYPAANYEVVAVGATARGSDARADFSSYNAPGDSWVDMAAPGNVTAMDRFGSANEGNYHTGVQGTSFSAPMVAGAAGLLKSIHPEYTGWALARALRLSARPISTDGWVKDGALDVQKLLTIDRGDLDAPTITGISAPGENWRMRGTFTVTPAGVGDAWSGVRVAGLYADGVYKSQDSTAPYALSYNTAGRNGPVKLQVRVYDKAGNLATFDRTIIADNTLPTVKITSAPKDKAKVSGTVKIAATAADTYGLRRVEMLINGKVVQTDTAAPYAFSFVAAKQPKTIKMQIRAVDLAGNVRYEATRNYTR
jgi:hypothetical protein